MSNRLQDNPQVSPLEQPEEYVNREVIQRALTAHPGKTWFCYSLPVPKIDLLSLLNEPVHSGDDRFYWEHPEEKMTLAAGGTAALLKATGSNRFEQIASQSQRLWKELIGINWKGEPTDPVLLGGYSFSDHNVQRMWKSFGAARFVLPEWAFQKNGQHSTLTLAVRLDRPSARTHSSACAHSIANELKERIQQLMEVDRRISQNPARPTASVCRVSSPPNSWSDWEAQIRRSRQMISDGVFEKIVIARHLDVKAENGISILHLLHNLRSSFPECFIFMIALKDGPAFAGATPERLISLNNNRLQTEGLAGSTARGKTGSEDRSLGEALMQSRKERSEHDYVVEDIRSQLKPYSLRLDQQRLPVIKKLNNVQHLCTPITAEVRNGISIHKLAGILHPTPAVGGFPKVSALPYIHEIEGIDRGWYAGPVGWSTLSGNGELAVAIRSAWIQKDRARLYAGSGIVRDSDPGTEWKETQLKFTPVLDALKQAIH